MKGKQLVKTLFTTFFLLAFHCAAQVPQILNYQGRIAVNGTNFTGHGQFKFALVDGHENNDRIATATAMLSGSFLTIVTVTDGGSGYTIPPTITITGGGGSNAVLSANISGGAVTSVDVIDPGRGYTSPPTITFSAPSSITYTTLWSNDGTGLNGTEPTQAVTLPVSKGLYSVRLGDTNLQNMSAIPYTIFTNTDVRVRVWFNDGINGFQQFTPDQRIAAVGYAMIAATVPDGSITANKIAPGSIGTAQLAPGLGLTTQVAGAGLVETAVNTAYVATNSTAPSAFTLPANANVGDKVRFSGSGGGYTLSASPGQTITGPAMISSRTSLPGGIGRSTFLASSADAHALFAAQAQNAIYCSNALTQWSPAEIIPPHNSAKYGISWSAVASSYNGDVDIAVSQFGAVFISGYGESWIELTNVPTGEWGAAAVSSHASVIAIMDEDGGNIYTSTDEGGSWTKRVNFYSNYWCPGSIATSYSGQRLAATWYDGIGYSVSISSDSGTNWLWQLHGLSGSHSSIASTADGDQLIVGCGTHLYLSTDFGMTWTASTNVLASGNWYSVASSAAGDRIVAATDTGGIYTSSDYGNTWQLRTNMPVSSPCFVSCDGFGIKILAASTLGGPLYLLRGWIDCWLLPASLLLFARRPLCKV